VVIENKKRLLRNTEEALGFESLLLVEKLGA